MENWNCDGSGPHTAGETRLLSMAGDGNLILCRLCFERERNWRGRRNLDLPENAKHARPQWDDCKVYGHE